MTEKKDSTPPRRPGPDKAEFKASEKPVERETSPELEAELAASSAKKGVSRKTGMPTGTTTVPGQAQPPQQEPPQFDFKDLEPLLHMGFQKYNDWIAGPPAFQDEKSRWMIGDRDEEDAVKALNLLDNKYNFSKNWMQYWPEIFAMIVFGGILGRIVMGARWKDKQSKELKEAQAEGVLHGAPQTVQPANVPASEKTPGDLEKEIRETMEKFGVKE